MGRGYGRHVSATDYCDLCDLPLSTCVHGMPKPVEPPPAPPKAPPKASPVTRRRTTTAAAAGSTAPAAPARPRRRTPSVDFKPWIVKLLQEAGGQAESDDLLTELAERLGDVLRPGDLEKGPTGEVRWRTAARTARKELADDGLLLAPRPGTWALTDRGRVEWVPDLPSA
ncbi:hypothetical protein NOK12_13840 [Nocardioides sp. OK12]|nr:hypothetical protein NOK12_13840 [Nocardioides sp. OK12]